MKIAKPLQRVEQNKKRLFPFSGNRISQGRSQVVCVGIDGNCVPRSFSLSLFCTEDFHEEVRCRICIDSVVNKEHYLSLPKNELDMLCTLSECQGTTAKDIFKKEVMDVCKLGTYMGLWQMMAAATALNVKVLSVYPPKGQSCGQLLNRTVVPGKRLERRRRLKKEVQHIKQGCFRV
ncbi:hypothetical protein ElyMa_000185100 [Elysia marginata]|uniref:Uncharacterized protein n=1 Tax=Elysia marginata TaxID=1093978 RepID=A0AAV4EV45_9GAST|nr:hypothetical protein ElyMa_000185100 [Elysia marginata]